MADSIQEEVLTVEYVSGICVATVLVPELTSSNSEELSSRLLQLLNDGKSSRFPSRHGISAIHGIVMLWGAGDIF